MHGWRPRPGVTDHHVAAAVDYRPATAVQKNRIISRGHSSLSASPARLPTGFPARGRSAGDHRYMQIAGAGLRRFARNV
jgi:hypothetical protein